MKGFIFQYLYFVRMKLVKLDNVSFFFFFWSGNSILLLLYSYDNDDDDLKFGKAEHNLMWCSELKEGKYITVERVVCIYIYI